jgi:hypothetical protein
VTELGWEPITPAEVADTLQTLKAPWWIAGGQAIDAFLGRETHDPGDIDVGVFREDQLEVQAALADWDLQAADPPGSLRPWLPGETLPEGVYDVWCRCDPQAAWGLRLMLDESDDDDWVYRRMPAVRRPLSTLTWTLDGVPYLAPEVQLLYKSGTMSPANAADFEVCLPRLSSEQRRWLDTALALAHPGHPWRERLL